MYLATLRALAELSWIFASEKVKEARGWKRRLRTVRAVLHKLKGSSSTFGADGVQQCEELREHCINAFLDKCRKGEARWRSCRATWTFSASGYTAKSRRSTSRAASPWADE